MSLKLSLRLMTVMLLSGVCYWHFSHLSICQSICLLFTVLILKFSCFSNARNHATLLTILLFYSNSQTEKKLTGIANANFYVQRGYIVNFRKKLYLEYGILNMNTKDA